MGKLQHAEHHAKDSHNGTGSSRRDHQRPPIQAHQGACDRAGDINAKEEIRSEDCFGEGSQHPQCPHVHHEMGSTDMNERRAQNPPPLMLNQYFFAGESAPANQLPRRRPYRGEAPNQHRQKCSYVKSDEKVCCRKTPEIFPRPVFARRSKLRCQIAFRTEGSPVVSALQFASTGWT